MAGQLKLRRGTTSQLANYIGSEGELTYDTALKSLVLHDGVTAGGVKIPYLSNGFVPSTMLPTATESLIGASKIATTAIAQEGVNDTDIMTAKKLRDALNASGNAPVYAVRAIAQGNSASVSPVFTRKLSISTASKINDQVLSFTFTTAMPDNNYTVLGFGSDQAIEVEGIPGGLIGFDQTTTGFKVRYAFSPQVSSQSINSFRLVVL